MRKNLLASLVLAAGLLLPFGAEARPYELNTPEARALAGVIDQLLLAHSEKDLNRLISLFHPQARALWSNGKQMANRNEIKQTYADSFLGYRKFSGSWMPDFVDIEGETAWMTGEMNWSAVSIKDQSPMELSVRSTYILRRVNGNWQIVLEHSSHRRNE
ncbi:hypothetical protein COW36_20605 [bacterium (Candidatus Blackallbacteria) CG17_big_fil_post_rev_8_21_14_2_50_48_46]|uniref:SnoaL-like domain-containing protein n=1 Tax=bacterium (Candidatus Blackallbacteria) CG17_big_fil_post_rev_8_21_14_2_50_48_46 TaxID=2014261 RepID=A0A2M7FZI2_9BACT|nr:MAG: hypothetical protein COW64_22930 [bacterium (Candidatus Blackallbacteria) CG18_big_fil_WC_8_21_14_2_50_49_26]PIW14807.1 MAG: hypothetical protein COW36_20605 [bacterium (Candidatus Blackallbacteria) CG17_big_fil_post_rev_8_21_14_2_50_48_46]PIW50909.1 MAG: hypothetical protein COW20_01420 [bacterium (Candidatus Blackallbacteria) CG13_big_fil_rev_8_21_14_2_50_49_14]